ncbi:MAG TPA: nuclear transport factor 2 family protein, partial [Bacteroidales bacterium]|nr:nuclear transport factor 2 family protein [Bacteroidales bacterium]
RWNNGDPSGFLEISAKDVSYFDPMTEQRLDGLDKLTELYEKIRGEIHVDKYDMINPKVQSADNMAVLTFNLISYTGEIEYKWNCTEVYRLDDDGWKIIQTHWSFTKPDIK